MEENAHVICPDCGAKVERQLLVWTGVVIAGVGEFRECPVCAVGSPAKAWEAQRNGA